MAVLNFPLNPSNGDTYTENSVTYKYEGTSPNGHWSASNIPDNTSDVVQAFYNTFVEISGETMSGPLKIDINTNEINLDPSDSTSPIEFKDSTSVTRFAVSPTGNVTAKGGITFSDGTSMTSAPVIVTPALDAVLGQGATSNTSIVLGAVFESTSGGFKFPDGTTQTTAVTTATAAETKTAYESNANTNAYTDSELNKLAGIESAATADQTGAEIKAAYETNGDTNAYTDAEKSKLTSIEASATADQTGAEIKTAYEAEANTNAFTDSEKTKLTGIETSATADQTGAEIKTAYEAEANTNAFTDSEKTKLTGIETSATADQTGAEIKTAYEAEANTNAFTDSEKTKLTGISAGAEVNAVTSVNGQTGAVTVAGNTDLSYTGSSRELASSTGNNVTLPEVTAAGNSGLMTGADKTKLDGISTGAEVNAVTSVNGQTGAVTVDGTGISSSLNPPSSPSAGDLWYETDGGRGYIYYNDGDSNQWVEFSPGYNNIQDGSVTPAKLSTGGPSWNSSTSRLYIDSDESGGAPQTDTKLLIGERDGSYSPAITLAGTGGTINFADGGSVNSGFVSYAHSLDRLTVYSNDNISLQTNGAARLSIDNSGKVGVGTASPATNLHVYGATVSYGLIESGDGAYNPMIEYKNPDQRWQAGLFGDDSDAFNIRRWDGFGWETRLKFDNTTTTIANGSGITTIDSSGRVLVGATSPYVTDANFQVTDNTNAKFVLNNPGDRTYSLAVGTDSALAFRDESNSAERMRIDSLGRTNIGTTTPVTTAALNVAGTTDIGAAGRIALKRRDSSPSGSGTLGELAFTDSGTAIAAAIRGRRNSGTWTSGSSQPSMLCFYTTPDGAASTSEVMRVDSTGIVAIGTSLPLSGSKLTVAGHGLAITGQNGAHSANSLRLGEEGSGLAQFRAYGPDASTSGQFSFVCSASDGGGTGEAMRIDSSGEVMIGHSSPVTGTQLLSIRLVTGMAGMTFEGDSSDGRTAVTFRNTNGEVGWIGVSGSNTSYNTSSDYRLKENVVGMTGAIDRVKQLNPCRFNFISEPDTTVDGFMAHEAQQVVPEAVFGEKDGEKMQGIDQSKLVPLLTAALKEAIGEIETLKQRLNDAGI